MLKCSKVGKAMSPGPGALDKGLHLYTRVQVDGVISKR